MKWTRKYIMISLHPLFVLLFYSFLSFSLAIFLTPQQTKYFGELATGFKQVGFFTKYQTAENFVYVFSWIFLLAFFWFSFMVAKTF